MLTQRRLGFLAGFLAYIAALWFLWDTRIVYPLKIFVVFLHELSHGIAAILGSSYETARTPRTQNSKLSPYFNRPFHLM